jgi:hypothetical protein
VIHEAAGRRHDGEAMQVQLADVIPLSGGQLVNRGSGDRNMRAAEDELPRSEGSEGKHSDTPIVRASDLDIADHSCIISRQSVPDRQFWRSR